MAGLGCRQEDALRGGEGWNGERWEKRLERRRLCDGGLLSRRLANWPNLGCYHELEPWATPPFPAHPPVPLS